MRTIACLAAILVAGSASAATPRLAVAALDAPPDLTFTGRSLSEAIAAEARAGGGQDVLGPDAVDRALGREGAAALVACADDARCLAERAARLDVDRLVAGFVQRSGDRYTVMLVHVDVRAGRRIAWVRRDVPVASRRLRPDVLAAVPGLLSGNADRQGTLEVDATAPAATVRVDDRERGTTPLALDLAAGRHKLAVAKPGFAAADPVWIEVPPGARVRHVQRLHEIPARERPNDVRPAGADR